MSSFNLNHERTLLREQWSTLSLVVFLFCAANELVALAVVKAGGFEIFLDVGALVVGLFAQHFLFGFRFFTTQADRRLFGPRRYAMVFGGAFKEGIKVPTFSERAGASFWWRVAILLFGAGFFFYALINAQWFTFVMLFNILFCTLLINAFDFWRPVVWSILFLLFTVLSHHGSASGVGLLTVMIAGAELLVFAALQSHLERRAASEATSRIDPPLKPVWSWFMPVMLFAVATVLVYPLMPGKRTNPLPKTHWAKRLSQGSAKGPSLSSLKKLGDEKGQGTGSGSEAGSGSGTGSEEGMGESSTGQSEASSQGQRPPNPQEVAKMMNDLQRQMEKQQPQSGESGDSQSGEERDLTEQSQQEQDIDPEQYKSKLQNLAKLGKNTAEKLGGGSSKSEGPDKKNAPATRKFPKLDMKRLLPILILLLTIAGLIVMMLLKRKKATKLVPPQVPILTRAQQTAALQKLEARLVKYAGKTEGVTDNEVIETYHIFLDFLKSHETPKADHSTPDEFAVDVNFLIKRKEMQPLTRVFCGTLYGKRCPSRAEFNDYLDNVREVAKAVHDEVRR